MTGKVVRENYQPQHDSGETSINRVSAAEILDMQTDSLHDSLGRLASPLGQGTWNDEVRLEPLIEQIHKSLLEVVGQYINSMNENNRHSTICSIASTYLAEIRKRSELFEAVWPGCEPLNETASDVYDRVARILHEAEKEGDLAGAAPVIAFMMHYEMNVDIHDVMAFINKDRAVE